MRSSLSAWCQQKTFLFSDYRTQFLKAVNIGLGTSSRGLWINSCYAHCQSGSVTTWLADKSPVVGNTVMKIITSVSLLFRSPLHFYWSFAGCFLTAENGKGSWRLVLWSKCFRENWLPLPLQPYLRQYWFRVMRAVTECRFIVIEKLADLMSRVYQLYSQMSQSAASSSSVIIYT